MVARSDIVARFWAKVKQSENCWLWIGTIDSKGYGRFGFSGGYRFAHRFSYELAHGSIPEGLCVCHHCDNPPCVRPEHLFAGTISDNLHDMVAKGRFHHQKGSGLPQGLPLQGAGFTVAERQLVRDRFRQDYGSEMAGARAVLRAFTRSVDLRQLVVETSRPFADPNRRFRPDRDGEVAASTLFIDGFSSNERARIAKALTSVFRSISQSVRTLALAYESSDQVRQSVHRIVPPTNA